jgi:hypothetical protein
MMPSAKKSAMKSLPYQAEIDTSFGNFYPVDKYVVERVERADFGVVSNETRFEHHAAHIEYFPSLIFWRLSSRFSGPMSVRKPSPPRLMPTTGFCVKWQRWATERKVPSPPTEMTASLEAMTDCSSSAMVASAGAIF